MSMFVFIRKRLSMRIKQLLTVLMCLFILPSVYAQEVISEKIIFLGEDGMGYVRYDTTRTNNPSYDIWFKKEMNQVPEKHLKDYLYMYPDDYKWDSTSQSGYDLMKIASGSYATLIQGKLINKTEVNVGDDGVYTYSSWDGKSRMADNHYGIWNKPDNFTQLVHAWVFPQNFNIISYVANKKGKWVKRNNTITYYGENVNDLAFTIKYQPRSSSIYKDLLKVINEKGHEKEQIKLEQNAKGVKITLAATVLFSSGSSDLSANGSVILSRLSRALSKRDDLNVVIEGHTDNVPIMGALAKKYKTNWELSAARSLTVLHYMAGNNVLESHLESRAYGALRPVFSNETELGRAKNRRIEILVIDAHK